MRLLGVLLHRALLLGRSDRLGRNFLVRGWCLDVSPLEELLLSGLMRGLELVQVLDS